MNEEVVTGARCWLTDTMSGKEFSSLTDNFGDFWFNDLEESIYDLKIESASKTKILKDLKTEKDLNLGDIPLT